MRYRVTIRGDGVELRGYATYEAIMALGKNKADPYIVVASEAKDDYDPFTGRAQWAEDDLRTPTGKVLTETELEALADEAERGYDVDNTIKRVDRR